MSKLACESRLGSDANRFADDDSSTVTFSFSPMVSNGDVRDAKEELKKLYDAFILLTLESVMENAEGKKYKSHAPNPFHFASKRRKTQKSLLSLPLGKFLRLCKKKSRKKKKSEGKKSAFAYSPNPSSDSLKLNFNLVLLALADPKGRSIPAPGCLQCNKWRGKGVRRGKPQP